MKDEIKKYVIDLLYDIAATDSQIVLLAILLVATVIVLDAISRFARSERRRPGSNREKSHPGTNHSDRSVLDDLAFLCL